MAGMGGGGGGGYQQPQQPTYQSSNPYAANYKPPTGPQGTPVGPITPAKPGAAETEDERRRRQALILGTPYEGLGMGGGADGGTSGGTGDASSSSDGGGTAP